MMKALLLLLLPMVASCSEGASGDGVGGASASEARALNDAVEMIDRRAAAPAGMAPPGLNPAAARAAKKEQP